MPEVKLGINLWSQAGDWPSFLEAGQRAEALGYDHLWTWDHIYAIFGDPDQPIHEGYTALAALAQATERIRLGLFVGANTFRNPGLAVKSLVTIDHVSDGRAILGIGGAWFELEHDAFGIDFGDGFGQRLDWLAEAVGAMRTLLDGGEVTSRAGGRYAFDRLRISPRPVQAHLPIMIGGGGEKKTLRIVAEHADMWNVFGTPETVARKDEILREHCATVGRDSAEIERTLGFKPTIRSTAEEAQRVFLENLAINRTPTSRMEGDVSVWTGTPEQIAETILGYRKVGFHTFIAELPAPYDAETMESLIGVVKPMVEAEPVPS
ncbi:MAG TPA: LLM class flavin-dependent oxidoreductase [Candidatus Limnocylindrales bacterium]|nr:LLM class flavin-dependent oxidoreductase [Candidatus Limnocylindrales bacterium]